MSDEPGKWGTNRKGNHVHYFIERAGKCESLCGRMRNYDEALNARLGMDHWDPEDGRTCRTCNSMRRWFKVASSPKEETAKV